MLEEKVTNELSELVQKSLEANPNELVKVIINLDDDADLEEVTRSLSKAGLNVASSIPGPVPIVAGAVAAKDIFQLAKE